MQQAFLIRVKSQEVEVTKGKSKRTGNDYTLFKQTAYLHTGDEVRRITVNLREGQTPYAQGDYGIAADSFRVSDYGDLEIARLHLDPLVRPQPKA